jgi:hypothetical protein
MTPTYTKERSGGNRKMEKKKKRESVQRNKRIPGIKKNLLFKPSAPGLVAAGISYSVVPINALTQLGISLGPSGQHSQLLS